MKPLIRLFLFMIARLGLLFAVLAWVVGQWWPNVMALPSGVCVAVTRKGCLCAFAEFGTNAIGHYKTAWSFTFPPQSLPILCDSMIGWSIAGITSIQLNTVRVVSIHHWLITTIFIAFNLFLHFIYRKRPELAPCED